MGLWWFILCIHHVYIYISYDIHIHIFIIIYIYKYIYTHDMIWYDMIWYNIILYWYIVTVQNHCWCAVLDVMNQSVAFCICHASLEPIGDDRLWSGLWVAKPTRVCSSKYPPVNVCSLLLKIAIYSWLTQWKLIFHCYVSLPEGTCIQVMWKEETMPYTSHDWEW